jgi:ABC-type branched-subunit amino acid transport system substrate-binding protein
MQRGSTTGHRVLTLLVAAGLLAAVAGCGARWSDEERAGAFARGATKASSSERAVDPAAGDQPAVALGGPTGAAGPATATSVAGATTRGGTAGPSGPRPCTAHSTAPGVADQVLTVANLSSLTGPVPGLGATSQAATRAYVAYRNATGGVCGRQIKLLEAEDQYSDATARRHVIDFAPRALGIVGLFAPSAAGGTAEILEREKMPIIGSVGNEEIRKVSTSFNVNPPPPDPNATLEKFRYLYSQGVRTAAVATLSAAAAVLELNQHQAQIEAAGIRIVSRQILPVTTLSFDSAARVVANSGADYLFFLGADQHDAAFAVAMRGTGYHPKFEEYLTGYGSNYVDIAGSAAEGTSSWIRTLPAEEGSTNAELALFLKWMATAAPGVRSDVFAADAWGANKAFFDALEQLPGPITREAVVNQLRTFTHFDAAGMVGPIDLGHSLSNGCLIGMRYEDGRWQRFAPAKGFLC